MYSCFGTLPLDLIEKAVIFLVNLIHLVKNEELVSVWMAMNMQLSVSCVFRHIFGTCGLFYKEMTGEMYCSFQDCLYS